MVNVVCQQCHTIFQDYPHRQRKFCCSECLKVWLSEKNVGENHPRWKGGEIKKLCVVCGNEFEVKPFRSTSKFCSRYCRGVAIRGIRYSIKTEFGQKPSWNKGLKGYTTSLKGKTYEEIYGTAKALIMKKEMSIQRKGRGIGENNPFYGKHHTEESNRNNAEAHKGRVPWNKGLTTADERLLEALRACHRKPNKKEQQLILLVEQNRLPFKYTGDGSFVIGGYMPDFVNTNGKKQIIELFGDYWHNRENMPWHQTELGRMMAYSQFGYKSLIIWERELKKPDEIISKIKRFMKTSKTRDVKYSSDYLRN